VFEDKGADFEVRIAKKQDSPALAWIMLTNTNADLSHVSSGTGILGEMVSLLGSPTVVDIGSAPLTVAYYAANNLDWSAMRAGSDWSVPISLDDPVFMIRLYAPGNLAYTLNGEDDPFLKEWQGFRQFGYYYWVAPSASFSR
jgi:hypothetical protein